MAYLGTKSGAERLAKQLREDAATNRRNAAFLVGDPDLPNEAERLLKQADDFEREAEELLK